jgi:MFS family permease
VSALLAALANAVFVLASAGVVLGLALRFATGFYLAGVYPPGMKMMASWFREGRGLALGILIGALTLGKASPYLVNAIGSAD